MKGLWEIINWTQRPAELTDQSISVKAIKSSAGGWPYGEYPVGRNCDEWLDLGFESRRFAEKQNQIEAAITWTPDRVQDAWKGT